MVDYAGADAPDGWLLCYGQEISREDPYDRLFETIGTTYGAGNGTSSFLLPDLRGRVAAGKDDMGGTSASRLHPDWAGSPYNTGVNGTILGSAGGEALNQLTVNNLAAHAHGASGAVNMNLTSVEAANSGLVSNGGGFQNRVLINRTNYEWGVAVSTDNAGSNYHHNNTQPTIILNKIIRYQ